MPRFVFLLLFFLASCCAACITRTDPHVSGRANAARLLSDTFTLAEAALLHDGDIVLRRGEGMVSDRIVATLHERVPLSHCGLFYRTAVGDSVISSESNDLQGVDGVQRETLAMFAHDAMPHTLVVVRPVGTEAERLALVVAAKYYLSQRIGFDYSFALYDSSRMYCAEFVQHAFRRAYRREVVGRTVTLIPFHPFLTMQQFYDNPAAFDLIIDHSGKARNK